MKDFSLGQEWVSRVTKEGDPEVSVMGSDVSRDVPDYLAKKDLGNGRAAWVCPITFGKGRIVVGPDGAAWYDDGWCYETHAQAIAALGAWDGTGEPEGWFRHPISGRRRPNGDPLAEYVSR